MSDSGSAFDRALVRFLTERAASIADVDWSVKYDGETEWEVALWLGGDAKYAGTWRVTEDGSTLLDPDKVEFRAVLA